MKDTWHVLPTNDVEEHEESIFCHCNPTQYNFDEGPVIVHNAFDGRELYEIDEYQKN